MPHVHFTHDYDHHPRSGVVIAYRAGGTYSVTTACATRAIAAGKARRITTPNKDETYGEPAESGRDARAGALPAARDGV